MCTCRFKQVTSANLSRIQSSRAFLKILYGAMSRYNLSNMFPRKWVAKTTSNLTDEILSIRLWLNKEGTVRWIADNFQRVEEQ